MAQRRHLLWATMTETLWLRSWEQEKSRSVASSPLPEASWKAGGRASKKYPEKENEEWWHEHGPTMVQAWIDWRQNGWSIWEAPNGQPAIELALNPSFGEVPIKMVLDRVFVTPNGELVVVDLKTGRTEPTALQLAWYAAGMDVIFGVRPKFGAYWMARDGLTTPLVDLDLWPTDMIVELTAQFDKARKAGIFLPNHSSCKMCSVKSECKWYKGEDK